MNKNLSRLFIFGKPAMDSKLQDDKNNLIIFRQEQTYTLGFFVLNGKLNILKVHCLCN